MNRITALILTLLLLCGCVSNKRVDIVSIGKITPKELTNTGVAVELTAVVKNEFNKKINIEKADFSVFHNNRQIASVQMEGMVTIDPKEQREYTFPLRLRVGRNVFNSLIPILLKPTGFKIEGTVVGRVGMFRKKVKFNRELTEQNIKEIVEQIKKEIGI